MQSKVILDAGCGHSQLDIQLAASGAQAVVSLDASDTVDAIFEQTRAAQNIHVVQGDVMAPPLRQRAFDVVWCAGVLHHTADAQRAFRNLASHVKPSGLLYVWVYPARFSPWLSTKRILDRVGLERLPHPAIYRLATMMSYPSYGVHAIYRRSRSLSRLAPRTAWGQSSVQPMSREAMQMIWHDMLIAPLESQHTEAEVEEWFRAAGFVNIVASDEPKIGMRGRLDVDALHDSSPVAG